MTACQCRRFGDDFQTADADALVDELTELAVNGRDWEIVYSCPRCDTYWLRTYPNSEHHGGGIPRMQIVDADTAGQRIAAAAT